MSSLAHAVVWIDHGQARVIHFDADTAEHLVVHPHGHSKEHIHHKAGSIGSGHTHENHDYLQQVAQAIADAGAVLVTGPANEKTELLKHIEKHLPALKGKIKAVQPLSHITDGELLAHARKFFAADHQMPPRFS
jgi:stalled ribosome rescue protein Dom34